MTINDLIRQLSQVVEGAPWYGQSVLDVINKVKDPNASIGSNSIGQILEHMLAWRKYAIKKIEGNLSYDIQINSLDDWNKGKIYSNEEFITLRQQLQQDHQEMLRLLAEKSDDWLLTKVPGREKYTMQDLIHGIVMHDVYHLGQIAVLLNVDKL